MREKFAGGVLDLREAHLSQDPYPGCHERRTTFHERRTMRTACLRILHRAGLADSSFEPEQGVDFQSGQSSPVPLVSRESWCDCVQSDYAACLVC